MKRFLLACLLLLVAAPAFAQTSLSFSSAPGEYVGKGMTKAYSPSNAAMSFAATRKAIRVHVEGHDGTWWDLTLVAPVTEDLMPREYFRVERSAFVTGRAPGLDFSGWGSGCNRVSGSFAIRQIMFDAAGQLSRLEATAIQYCDSNPNPLAIEVRYRSSPHMFGVDSAAGHWVGQGMKKSYYNDRSLMRLSASEANMITYDVSGLENNWTVQIGTPKGQARFSKGTFNTGLSTSTQGILVVTADGHACGLANSGVVNVLEVIYSPAGDRFDKFYADFTHYCDSSTRTGPPLKGRIRYVRGI